jgi:hypothetical protein
MDGPDQPSSSRTHNSVMGDTRPSPSQSLIHSEDEISTQLLNLPETDRGQLSLTSETASTLVPEDPHENERPTDEDDAMEVDEDSSSEVSSGDDLKVNSLFKFRIS